MTKIQITTATALGPKVREKKPEAEFMPVDMIAPETAIRRLEASIRDACRPDHSSELGFMKLRGELSEAQLAACNWFQELHSKYLNAIDAKTVKSGSAELVSKSEPPDPYSPAGSRRAKKDKQAIAEFDSAKLAAGSCGRGEYLLFEDVVLGGAAITSLAKNSIRKVAEVLRKYRAAASRFRRGRR